MLGGISSVTASTQEGSSNRSKPVKGEMKQSGKDVHDAGTSLGTNVKHGRVAHGGKNFGSHMYRAGKHFGKGTGRAAKKTGSAVKKAVKP
jgi:hypothetical protein